MRTDVVRRVLFAGAFCAAPAAAAAQFVAPTGYTATPGEGQAEGGVFDYLDAAGQQLTDGELGANDWRADLGSGPADEWVGWRVANPTLVFTFAAPVSLARVQIGFNRGQADGIYLPGALTVGGTAFTLAGTELADNTRGFLDFAVPFTGTTLTIAFDDGDRARWVFVDEVRFVAAPTQVVPEPTACALVAAGLAGVGAVARRRGRAPAA